VGLPQRSDLCRRAWSRSGALTVFVLAGNTLLRPLVNAINAFHHFALSSEATYQFKLAVTPTRCTRDRLVERLERPNIRWRMSTSSNMAMICWVVATGGTAIHPAKLEAVVADLQRQPGVRHATWEKSAPGLAVGAMERCFGTLLRLSVEVETAGGEPWLQTTANALSRDLLLASAMVVAGVKMSASRSAGCGRCRQQLAQARRNRRYAINDRASACGIETRRTPGTPAPEPARRCARAQQGGCGKSALPPPGRRRGADIEKNNHRAVTSSGRLTTT
jgi:hypothetical protein